MYIVDIGCTYYWLMINIYDICDNINFFVLYYVIQTKIQITNNINRNNHIKSADLP